MKIGAHLSVGKGFENTFKHLTDMGGNSLQLFSTSPRTWQPANWSDDTISEFNIFREKYKVHPIYFHASYLVNLADQERIGELSKRVLIAEMNIAEKTGISGSIIHLGSFKDYKERKSKKISNESTKQNDLFKSGEIEEKKENTEEVFKINRNYDVLIENIIDVLKVTPKNTYFIIENSATRKIGLSIDEIAYIIEKVKDKRVKVCLDTCHMHAGGIDLSSLDKLDQFLDDFDRKIDLDRLEVIHLNDSRDEFGSLRDRHDNLGEGKVGEDVFRNLINNSRTKDLAFILETPGYDNMGPDKNNFDKAISYKNKIK